MVTAQSVQLHIGLSKSEFDVDKHDFEFVSVLCAAGGNLNENIIITLPVADKLEIHHAVFGDGRGRDENTNRRRSARVVLWQPESIRFMT